MRALGALFLVGVIGWSSREKTVQVASDPPKLARVAGADWTGAAALVLDRVTVVDVEGGKLVPEQRVVIVGNRIQAVGAVGKVKSPKDAYVVDARGKYLIPGLWDMHTHSEFTNAAYHVLIAYGITGIRDAHSGVPLDTQVQRWREILAGTRVGPPRQLLTGQSFGQHYNSSDSAVVKHIVDSLKAHGANFLKVYPYSVTVAAAARRAGIPFGGHMIYLSMFGDYKSAPETAIEASDSGMRIFDHITPSKLPKFCFGANASPEQCRPVAEHLRKNASWLVPTLSWEKFSRDKSFGARADEFWSGGLLQGSWLRDSVLFKLRRLADSGDGLLRVAQRVGLPILAGTDAPNGGAPLGFSLHMELAMYVLEGLTPLEALRTATLNPAKLLHGTDSLGTVAPGKLADLVLLDADPLTDITNTTTIRAVVANGRYFERAALDRLLTAIQTKPKEP